MIRDMGSNSAPVCADLADFAEVTLKRYLDAVASVCTIAPALRYMRIRVCRRTAPRFPCLPHPSLFSARPYFTRVSCRSVPARATIIREECRVAPPKAFIG